MVMSVTQTATAVGLRCPAAFQGNGGTAPYTYSVDAGGVGGTINAATGEYTAPSVLPAGKYYDIIRATDSFSIEATANILVGPPLLLFCEIVQKVLGLANGRVYLWDQKIMQPTDSDLYVAVSVPWQKVIGNVNRPASSVGGLDVVQFVSMQAMVDVDAISRGPAARTRVGEIVRALKSDYSIRQQDACGFFIAPNPTKIVNLSQVDGAAIPYRYRFSVAIMFSEPETTPTDYFDDFSDAEVFTDPPVANIPEEP